MEINKLDINSKEFKKKFNVFKSAKYNKRENRKRLVVVIEDGFFYFCICVVKFLKIIPIKVMKMNICMTKNQKVVRCM